MYLSGCAGLCCCVSLLLSGEKFLPETHHPERDGEQECCQTHIPTPVGEVRVTEDDSSEPDHLQVELDFAPTGGSDCPVGIRVSLCGEVVLEANDR